eukprot:CAMPEP_0179156572 /NCGR_PEP_ID=MMETSP0796-20121207/76334_1 /TAXON_ID=73915 /ORGANISM="Pyrodinium bahamense, Strain pbaha01" /LENGTH=62 /DNA_ID=CAMNT_0020858157 /DNA_START=88 /DNA_END=273 /DNA_ORIENTATION=+
MEYGIAGAGVARSWSEKLAGVLGPGAEGWMFTALDREGGDDSNLDWFAALITALSVIVVMAG